MKRRIVVVSEYFYPNERTDAFLLTVITKKLEEVNDGNIKVICTSELGEHKEIESLNNKVVRLKNIKLNEQRIIYRVLKFIILTLKLSIVSFFMIKKNDRVFVTTNPAFLIPILSFFRIFKTFEYTILVYDVFPENIAATNIISNRGYFYKLIKKTYDWSYSKADKLIVLGRDMKEVVTNKTDNKVSINIIENWCDYTSVVPKNKIENKILKELKLTNKIIFSFVGNLGRVQGIETLLKASKLVTHPDFRLLFIGDGAYKSKLVEFIEKEDNCKVYYAGTFPISKQNDFLNACDVSIISLNNAMYGLGVPSKSYYNMAAEKPILYIGDQNSEIARVVKEHKIGWQCKPNNEVTLAKLIDKICNNSSDFNELGTRARKVVKEYFSKEVILSKYTDLYKEKN